MAYTPRTMDRRRLAGIALVLLAACGKDSAPSGERAQAPAVEAPKDDAKATQGQAEPVVPPKSALATAAAAEADELGALPAPRGELRDPRVQEKYERRDSKLDGWNTELFNERAGTQLSTLGKLLANPQTLDSEHVAALVDADFACVDLTPPLEPTGQKEGLLSAGRNVAPSRESVRAGVDGALAAFREVAEAFAGGELSQAKFKVTSVEEREGSVFARAYLHARGTPKRGTVQLQSTWSMEWTPVPAEPADALPLLVKLELEHHEELLRPGSDQTLFGEATDAVFGADRAFQQQLRPDLEHWAARTDRSLGMSLIGHEGFALGDVDGDGLDDLYLAQPGGLPNRLFLRQADGTARDVAAAAGVDFLDPCRSALFADFDNDGDQDLAVELDPYVLFLANDGKGHFTPRARASAPSTTSLSAADFDGDGDLDLYCCGYILPDSENVTPLPYHDANNGRPNTLLRNDGLAADGKWNFVDATREVGLDENNRRFSFAASWEDFDDDGDLDLYVANDFGRNNLYRNDGGHFHDVAAAAGVEDLAAGMGVSWGDYDLDGDFDLYVSNMFSSAGERVAYQRKFLAGADPSVRSGFQRHARGNSLFRNLGDGTFEDVSEACGVTMGRWAWGSVFSDLDEDGWPDIVVPNGFVTGSDPADL
jgi:hypothetical protein